MSAAESEKLLKTQEKYKKLKLLCGHYFPDYQ